MVELLMVMIVHCYTTNYSEAFGHYYEKRIESIYEILGKNEDVKSAKVQTHTPVKAKKRVATVEYGSGGQSIGSAESVTRSAGQCVTYARNKSGIQIFGNANTWVRQAARLGYSTGNTARVGAVLYENLSRFGHVSVVISVRDEDFVIEERNYRPGMITRRVIRHSSNNIFIYQK